MPVESASVKRQTRRNMIRAPLLVKFITQRIRTDRSMSGR